MMSRRLLSLLATLFLAAPALPARAGMISLTYSGANEDNPFITAMGTGSISFADGATSLTLANVQAFTFTQTTTLSDPSLPGSSTYTFGLADLVSFSATISSAGAVTALSLRTGYESPPNGFLNPQYLVVGSLRRGATTFYQSGPDGDVTTGTMTASAVPEPSSLALAGMALLIAGGWRRRRG